MPLDPGPWVSCQCKYMKVQKNTAVKHGDDVHRADGPCYSLAEPHNNQ